MKSFVRRLQSDTAAVALIEFALCLPIFIVLMITGAEITNYTVTRMRISQLALHIADNAARMGNGTMLQQKTVNEADILDIFAGANLQAAKLDLRTQGRVILSNLEPQANPNTANQYRIRWQRCYGTQTHASSWGGVRQNIPGGIGPTGHQTIAQDNNATMFVELFYRYKPLVMPQLAPSATMIEVASMSVRDRRDLTGGNNGVYPVTGVTPATC
jgi:hypothetical protein